MNDTLNVQIQRGTISELKFSESFDIVLANINKNVLMAEMKQYAWHLVPGGVLLISGFMKRTFRICLRLLKTSASVSSHEVREKHGLPCC
ncbi:MAG: 50S ribosomal protein L11 methyltransferase [Bacteroidota bacterium]